MRSNSTLISIILLIQLILTGSTFAQSSHKSTIDREKQSNWINNTTTILRNFNPEKAERIVKLKTRDFENEIHQSYRIVKEGFFEMNQGEWVYIILHSSHTKDSIGDIALGINQIGKIYIHYGHICGGIVHYKVVAPDLFTRSDDFFKYFVDDTEGYYWEIFKE